jgi:hypothetical protein
MQKDFSKEIGRPFISTRSKIKTTYEYYALLFNDKGSGTGIQSESELVGVMRIFVDLWNKEKADAGAKEVDSRTTAKESRRAKRDHSNMLRRASDKEYDTMSELDSDGSSSFNEDQTSDEDTGRAPASPELTTPARRESSREISTSRSRGRGRHRVQGRRKRARIEYDEDADRAVMKELLDGMAADRALRQQELALQREKDNASIAFMKQLGEALVNGRMT